MSNELLDSLEPAPKTTKVIDDFFKAYLIFHSVVLLISFLLSLFNAPENAFIHMFFNAMVFIVTGFNILYIIFLIIKKKGGGRILINLINIFSLVTIAIGFLFFFARWPYRLEMLTVGLLTVPFLHLVQLIYELVVREEKTKFTNIFSFIGVSSFSIGLLFFLQNWPNGASMLIIGGGITLVMFAVHLSFVFKDELRYKIHTRYLAQCLYALISSIMILLVQ